MMTSSEAGAGAPRAVVAGHGDFAAGIISAVDQISGRGSVFRAVSNSGLDPAALLEVLGNAVAGHGARAIFTDLPAGSCTIAARRCARERPGLAVVTGANLAMLLDFALKGGDGASAARAAERGREAIIVTLAAEPGGAH
ncbi:MAG: PTS sugar transporter subunit IIA [Gemmatimonadales bacterium]